MLTRHQLTRCCVLGTCALAGSAPVDAQSIPVREAPQQVTIESNVLDQRRPVLVYLPESYRHTTDRYPVLVVLDGEDAGTTLALSAVNLLTDFARGEIPELIVVTIPNLDRSRDLIPAPVNGGMTGKEGGAPSAPRGRADVFLRFIENELLPEIDRRYRAHPVRFLQGNSAGGLFGIFAFVTRPELFRGIVASSPALWIDQHAWLDSLRASLRRRPSTPQQLYVSAGEFDHPLIRTPLPAVDSALRSSAPRTLAWRVEVLSGRDHQSAGPAALANGLRHVFAEFNVPYPELVTMTPDSLRRRYANLSPLFGWPVRAPSWAFNRMGLITDLTPGRPRADAIGAFGAIVSDYPWHPYGYEISAYFLAMPGADMRKAVVMAEDAVRVARRSGYWPGALEAMVANFRGQLPK